MKTKMWLGGTAAMLVLLAGCGGGSNNNTVASSSASSASSSSSAASVASVDAYTQVVQSVLATTTETGAPIDVTALTPVSSETATAVAVY